MGYRASMLLSTLVLACSSTPDGTDRSGPVRQTPTTSSPDPSGNTIADRFEVPNGFVRSTEPVGSFGHYLRHLRLRADGERVHLFNGELKWNQRAHAAVIDISVGKADLQQCADAVMRLRAEHLYGSGQQDDIAFHFTSGFNAEWSRWRAGERVRVSGNDCAWTRAGEVDGSHEQLMAYLQKVFTYAGTLSLSKELRPAGGTSLQAGDVFVQGGSPGHAVIVVDVAAHPDGRTAFLLAQSYMPAQEIHVLVNPHSEALSPWYILGTGTELITPEWTFAWSDWKRWP